MGAAKVTLLSFYEFVFDRQMIWHKRYVLKEVYPWSNDSFHTKFRYCWPYRELDKGTIYLIDTIINNKKLSLADKFLNCVAYRRFNLPGFFEWIGGPISCKGFDFEEYVERLRIRREKGLNLFNDAYIVSQTPYNRKVGRKEKYYQQMLILKDLAPKCEDLMFSYLTTSLEEIHKDIKHSIFGMGDFLTYQTVTDLTYFPEFKDKWDINLFVATGPGSKPGIDLLFPNKKYPYEWYCKYLFSIQEAQFKILKEKTGKNWDKIYYRKAYYPSPYLSLSNIQNCLCEWRKFFNLQNKPNCRKRYYRLEV